MPTFGHQYENPASSHIFLTVKRVGPETNEQHSSFLASAEHINHRRSDLSRIQIDEKKFKINLILDYLRFTSIISDQI